MSSGNFAEVAVFLPVKGTFEYHVPSNLQDQLTRGSICEVPFQNKTETGVILNLTGRGSYDGEYREIARLVWNKPIPEYLIQLAKWLTGVTLTPLGQVFNRMIPGNLSVKPRKKEVYEITESFDRVKDFIEDHRARAPKQAELLELLLSRDERPTAPEIMREANSSRSPLTSLLAKGLVSARTVPDYEEYRPNQDRKILPEASPASKVDTDFPRGFGVVTVSGAFCDRLSVYLSFVDKVISDRAALVVAPNIFRAEELQNIFSTELDCTSITYHSRLSPGEISSRWRLVSSGEVGLVVGVLSSIYLPFPRLGGIVVEGEADRNYQLLDQDPRANFVDICLERARLEELPVVLGDTSHSIFTYHNSSGGSFSVATDIFRNEPFRRVDLTADDATSDAATERINRTLRALKKKVLEGGGPAVLIGERTAASNAIICGDCGQVIRCPRCEVPLKFTKHGNSGVCPYCGYREEVLTCPNCGGSNLDFVGSGLEEVENTLNQILPEAEVRVFDSRKETSADLYEVTRKLLAGEIDVLIGTWMIASYYLYGKVDFLGLLGPDLILDWASYRSTEWFITRIARGFDLVADDGTIFARTYHGDNPEVRSVLSGDWERVYRGELKSRQRLGYPPFTNLIELHLRQGSTAGSAGEINELKAEMEDCKSVESVLGPVESGRGGDSDHTEEKLLIKTGDIDGFYRSLSECLDQYDRGRIRIVLLSEQFAD